MPTVLKRLLLLALALVVVAAPIAESATTDRAPVAGAAKKKGKKCKGKKKKKTGTALAAKKKGKKCKKKGGASPGLPGKPLQPTPPDDPDDPAPLTVQAVTLTENPLLAGSSGSGQVTVNAPAPAGGQDVTLGSSLPSRASVPDSIQITEGQATGTFPITTTAGPDDTVTLTAAIGASTRNAQLGIVEEESLNSLALDYQCFPDVNLVDFGANVVSLDVRAPTDAVVDLVSSDPFSLSVPSTVTVPQGEFTGVFGVGTGPLVSPPVTVTATYGSDVMQDAASVRNSGSPAPVASNLGLQPNSVVVGDSSTGTVSLDCEAPPGGRTVNLASDHPGAHVPASVVVPAGELSATFPITSDITATPGPAVISATAGNTVQATLTLRAIGT